jgi:glycosyltransferase involved in cell wall biosynthesis
MREIEIICVDDCSLDSSLDIVGFYADKDSRFRIITHSENRGEGAARNTGLRHAIGDFVFHLDSDDMIPPDALEILLSEAEKNNSELVKGGFEEVYPDGSTHIVANSMPSKRIVNTNLRESPFLQTMAGGHWTYLYRREFLKNNNLTYREDIKIGLDLIALLEALVHSKSVTLLDKVVYRYYQSTDSAVRGTLTLPNALDTLKNVEIRVGILRDNNLEDMSNHILQNWSFKIRQYWLRFPVSLTAAESMQYFSQFRSLMHNEPLPWKRNTPHHYRYLMALVLGGKDAAALDFLNSEEAEEGFSDDQKLIESLKYVLKVAPDDAGSLYTVGVKAYRNGQIQDSVEYFEKLISHNSEDVDGLLCLASAYRRMDRSTDATSALDAANRSLNLNNKQEGQVNCLINENLRLVKKEEKQTRKRNREIQQRLNSQLKASQRKQFALEKQLKELYGSLSWRITLPLRKIGTLAVKMKSGK